MDSALTGPMNEPATASLVERAKAGEREAFDALIGRFEDDVLKTALYLTRHRQDAEDVAQEVYIKIFRKLDSFQDPERIKAWVHRITVNTARDLLRRRKLWAPVERIFSSVTGSDPVQRSELRNRLSACLARLSFSERAAFIFRELHEQETAQVAEILGCGETTVRGHLHSARKKMRQYLSDYREGES